jgi:hypothetical protein
MRVRLLSIIDKRQSMAAKDRANEAAANKLETWSEYAEGPIE